MTPPSSMPTETEDHLRRRLHRYAATTRISSDALAQIVDLATGAPAPGAGQRRWLQAAVAGITAAAVALVVVSTTADRAEVDMADGTGVPPTIAGDVLGLVQTSAKCNSDVCPGSDVMRLALPSLTFERLTTEARATSAALAGDGRILATSEVGASHSLLEVGAEATTLLPSVPDLVAVAFGPGGEEATVVSVSGGSSGAITTSDLRVGNQTVIRGAVALSAPTFGPAGRLAVLQAQPSTRYLFHDAELVVFDGITEVARHRVQGVPPDGVLSSRPALSWSSKGLVAISGGRMDPFQGTSGDEALNTTLIVDPDTGATVRRIEGWHGLAWSPDGTGLLLTRPVAPRTTEVAVAYGASLASMDMIGSAEDYLTVLVWRPPPPTSLDVAGDTYEVRLEGERVCLQGGLLQERVCQGLPLGAPQARLDPAGGGEEDNVLFIVAPAGTSFVPPERASSADVPETNSTVLVGHIAGESACVAYTNRAGDDGLVSVGLTYASDPTPLDPATRCP